MVRYDVIRCHVMWRDVMWGDPHPRIFEMQVGASPPLHAPMHVDPVLVGSHAHNLVRVRVRVRVRVGF